MSPYPLARINSDFLAREFLNVLSPTLQTQPNSCYIVSPQETEHPVTQS